MADVGDQELRRLAHSSRRGTLELGAEDNDGPSQHACTTFTEEYPASAGHHASAVTDHARISGSLWADVLQHFEHAAACP